MTLLPRIEGIINKDEPTLEDILRVCSHDPKLLGRLTRRAGFSGSEQEFARDILFKKGLGFLKSLAIRSMNREIFEIPMPNSDLTPFLLKKRSVILARFLKAFSSDVGIGVDEAYLAGLLFNYGYVCSELTCDGLGADALEFEQNRSYYDTCASELSSEFGFHKVVIEVIEDAHKDFYQTRLPFAQALLRIGNETLANTEQTNGTIGRGENPDRILLDATGLRARKIFSVLKDISRNYTV
ncbi:MAG: hypothetical protein HN531_11340 [Opitutae bacterium]|nr:hypothetical protein [Opitutae bacterium]